MSNQETDEDYDWYTDLDRPKAGPSTEAALERAHAVQLFIQETLPTWKVTDIREERHTSFVWIRDMSAWEPGQVTVTYEVQCHLGPMKMTAHLAEDHTGALLWV